MNADTKSDSSDALQTLCVPSDKTQDDLKALGDAIPEDELSRWFHLSSRLVLVWLTRAIKSYTESNSHEIWIWRSQALLIAAASGAPRLPADLDADRAYVWALSMEAFESQARRGAEGAAARAWLMGLPGYKADAAIQIPETIKQHAYLTAILIKGYDLAWQASEIYLALPDPEWRAAERWVLESSMNPVSDTTGGGRFKQEAARWLAELQSNQISSNVIEVREKDSARRL